MDITYQYTKVRNSFGRQPMFCEYGPELCDTISANISERRHYILRNPVHSAVQQTPQYSEHYVNTRRVEYTCGACQHSEGGWPRDVNVNDPETTQRYRRKVEKDDGYIHCVMSLASGMENLVLQNNAIDMYQTYYTELAPVGDVEHVGCRTVNVYRDSVIAPLAKRRPVTSICWRSDGAQVFAVTYLEMDYNRKALTPLAAYLWDVQNANYPETTLNPPHALLDLQYNPRNVELLVGALVTGQVVLWDRRARGAAPVAASAPHHAHRDLARAVRFINAKNGMELFSGGPDGVCKWWDLRNLNDPIDEMIIDFVASANDEPSMATAYGISCLEFEATIPTKFMAGTENGLVVTGNRKGKSAIDKLSNKIAAHLGPVWKVERNPGFLKNFLTVGDWTARVWSEECRESAVLWTPSHRHKIWDGAWSPTRMSLMLLVQNNGQLALWDLLRRQGEPILTVQLCSEPLQRIAAHESGSLVACGSAKGNVYLVELSRSLTESGKHDKGLLTAMFERESKRERILEARLREIRLKARAADDHSPAASVTDVDMTAGDRDLLQATTDYHAITKKELATM